MTTIDPAAGDLSLRRLNVNLLYTLNAVLHSATLTQAAKAMSLSQPAASMALRKLRDHFDDDLIVYGTYSHLTELGEALRPRVSRLLREIDDTFSLKLNFDPTTASRQVTLSAPEEVELMFLSRVVPRLLRIAPGVNVDLIPLFYNRTGRMLDRGADVSIVPATMADPKLSSRRLFSYELTGMVWIDFAGGDRLTAEQYAHGRHAALFENIERSTLGNQTRDPAIAQRHIVVRTAHYSMLPQLVIGTDLIVTTSNWLAQHYASLMPVRLVSLPINRQSVSLVAQWHPHRDKEPVIGWLLDQIAAAIDWPGSHKSR